MTSAKTAKGTSTSSPQEAPLPKPDEHDELLLRNTLDSARELERSETDSAPVRPSTDEPVPGIKFLTSILKATFFTDLFYYHADIRFGYPTRAERVAALQQAHPRFYAWTRNADFVSRAALMALVTALVTGAAMGTIFKLFFA